MKKNQRFNLDDTAVILIDHQVGTGMPVVLTSSQETSLDAQGPLMPELQEALPEAFADACRATGMKNFIMAGVTTDVCTVGPAVSAVEEGFDVQVVADAWGSTTQIAKEMSYRRLALGGVRLTSTNAIVAELVRDWTTHAGSVAFPLLTS